VTWAARTTAAAAGPVFGKLNVHNPGKGRGEYRKSGGTTSKSCFFLQFVDSLSVAELTAKAKLGSRIE